MSAEKFFYITTPIYYVNDAPHIGHAYTGIACDVLARFKRLDGYTVKFLTGTDEHGQKVEQSAQKKGIPTQQFTDEVSQHFRDLAELLNLSNDDFIRTTEQRHKQSAQAFWNQLVENEQIYLGSYNGWYSVRDEAYYQESELVNGKAPTGAEVEWVEEPSYFFKLSEWGDKLLEWYETGAVLPQERLNEVKSFVKGGLKDLSVSRTTFRWGIPVPGEPPSPKGSGAPSEKHVMYVWIDALVNYLTAAGYPDTQCETYRQFWPNVTHVVGKDILRFHAVYWPAMLMAAGLPVPRQVVAHGWWTVEGEKMSKSLGNVVVPAEMVSKYGLDAFRYFLMREKPLASDGNFAEKSLVERVNGELGNKVGNLAQRSLSMIAKHCEGKLPSNAAKEAQDADLLSQSVLLRGNIEAALAHYTPNVMLQEVMDFADRANEYIDREAPWKLKKENPARMEAVLYTVAETVRLLALALLPVVPESANKLLDQLAVPENERDFAHFSADHALKPGTPLPAPFPVFPRLEFVEK